MATIYSKPDDGWVYHTSNNWNTAHDAATGTTAKSDDDRVDPAIAAQSAPAGRSTNYYILRTFLNFDTSGISVAPSAATLNIYGYTTGIMGTTLGDIIAIEGTWTGASSLSTGDFDSFTGYQAGWDSGDVTAYSSELTSWSTSGYNSITLNATALAKMASASVLSIVLMNHDFDYQDTSPFVGGKTHNYEVNGIYFANATGTANDPYIDYTPVGYGHDVIGVDSGDIDTVIGVETGDIDTVIGVD